MSTEILQLTLPAAIDRARFLRDYWQKKPLLMRGALPAHVFSLQPDELAGLACETEIESRLIVQQSPQRWLVRHGPFDDADFSALPEREWTLLVQDVDKFVPDVARVIEAFDFMPSWRIDDIMISFAADGGGVGPHTDAYDVFLMQGHGRRRWRLSYRDYSDNDLIPGLEQRILAHFDTDEDWLLEPGDVLYLPPGIAHWGTADGDCMTYSLGFRAPSRRELAADWFQHLVSLADDTRLDDPRDLDVDDRARIGGAALSAAQQLLDPLLTADAGAFADWFGCYVTEPKPQFQVLPPDETWTQPDLERWIASDRDLVRHPAARLAWQESADGLTLFVQGEARRLSCELRDAVRILAQTRRLSPALLQQLATMAEGASQLIVDLLNEGVLEPDAEEE
ncbi:MAG: cupin domain-containing protein [Gammaproteobacteria bacterium]|nr:cupin domain-containing protein [Gammaproteobacteria bacterium]